MTSQSPGRSAKLPMGVEAWLSPGEQVDYVTRYRRGMEIAGLRWYVVAALGLVPLGLLFEAFWPVAATGIVGLLGLASRGGFLAWISGRHRVVLITDRRVLIVAAMGPQSVPLDDIERVVRGPKTAGRADHYGSVEITRRGDCVDLRDVDHPDEFVDALMESLGRSRA